MIYLNKADVGRGNVLAQSAITKYHGFWTKYQWIKYQYCMAYSTREYFSQFWRLEAQDEDVSR